MVLSDRREALLDRTVDYVLEHGLGALSLRELAKAIGSSHRMLIYHFGSKSGLLVAVVGRIEATQRSFLSQMVAQTAMSPDEAARSMWLRLADPALWPAERLFFELYGQALQGRPGTEQFLERVVEDWLGPLAEHAAAQGTPPDTARAHSRLELAITRGLLLDLLATGDRTGVDAALECYAVYYEAFRRARTTT